MDDQRRPSRLALPPLGPQSVSVGALLLSLLAFGLRLHRLDFQPLWGDEGWSFYFASMSLGDMLSLTATDIHPPLYYALLTGWQRLAGSTPASARLLSILFGTLLVPLTYRVASSLFDRTSGLLTALLVTLAPFAIYYSQEVRMYGLVTLLGLASVYFFSQMMASGPRLPKSPVSVPAFWGYALTTAAALYTMYYAVFLLVFQAVYLLTLIPGQKQSGERRDVRLRRVKRATRAMAMAVLLYLPWVVYAGTRLITYVRGKRVAEGYAPLALFPFVKAHIVTFSLGHLSPAIRSLAWVTLLLVAVAGLALLYRRKTRATASRPWPFLFPAGSSLAFCYLLIPLSAGYIVNRVYPFTPLHFERTLMLAAPAWWLLLGAGLVWLWRRSRPLMLGVSTLLLVAHMVALFGFYNVPRYQDEDYRPLLTYVRTHSAPEDVILASYQWQLGLYHAYLPPPHPHFYTVPGWGESWADDLTRMENDLEMLVKGHPRLWFPAYQSLGRLWETSVETTLNRIAFPAQVDWNLPGTKLTLYGQGKALAPVVDSSVAGAGDDLGNFDNRLALEQALVGDTPAEAGRGVIPIRLTWRKLGSLGSQHRVALRLTDAGGRSWASRDSRPQGGDASFTALSPGQRLTDHHGLLVPAGTPPGDYQLRLSVVSQLDDRPLDLLDAGGQPQGVEALLTSIQVVPPATPLEAEVLPIQHPVTADFDGKVRLLGYSLGDGPFPAGEGLTFSLFWQALADGSQPYVVFSQLQDETGHAVALSETPPAYPTDRWPAGMLLRDPHQIPLLPALPEGDYRLAVGLLRPDGSRLLVGGDDQVVLTTVLTTQRARNFSPPALRFPVDAQFGGRARLLGYDLHPNGELEPGRTFELVLYWQPIETFDRSYTVFVHLIDAGSQIVGNRDQVPGGGDFPTTSWVRGEYLTDVYHVPVNPDTPPGDYWIEVGFYDPVDGTRLAVTDAQGQPLGDRLLLEDRPVKVR